MELAWKKFNALGTEIVLLAQLRPEQKYLLDRAEASVFEFEKRFSRFIETSELSVLNKLDQGGYEISDLLSDILKHCQIYFEETGGLFDPTMIDALEAVGYQKNFSDLGAEQITHEEALTRLEKAKDIYRKRPKVDEIKFEDKQVILPKDFRIDLGGIGKGYIVDMISRDIFKDIENYWLSAGGDLLIKGNDLGKTGWRVGVQNPLVDNQESFAINTLGETLGIATSGVVKRHGITGGIKWHHLIDPRTGEPSKSDIISVTMIAPTAEQADIYAKTVLLLGSKEGLEFVEKRTGLECAIFFADKAPVFSSGIVKYL